MGKKRGKKPVKIGSQASLEVEAGQTVEWTRSTWWRSPVLRCHGLFDTELKNDETFAHTFEARGAYEVVVGSSLVQRIKVVKTDGECYTDSDSFADSDDVFSDGSFTVPPGEDYASAWWEHKAVHRRDSPSPTRWSPTALALPRDD